MQSSTLLKQGRAKICSCLWNPTKDWLTKLLSLVLHSLVFKINLMVQQWQKSRIYLISREAKLPNGDSILEKNVLKKTACAIKITMKLSLCKRFYIKMQSKYFFPFYKLDCGIQHDDVIWWSAVKRGNLSFAVHHSPPSWNEALYGLLVSGRKVTDSCKMNIFSQCLHHTGTHRSAHLTGQIERRN